MPTAIAQDENPIEILGFGRPGTMLDLAGRMISDHLSEKDHDVHFVSPDGNWEQWLYDPRLWGVGWDGLFWKIRKRASDSFRTILDLKDATELGFDGAFLSTDDDDGVYRIGLAWVKYHESNVKSIGECGNPKTWKRSDGKDAWDCIESDDLINFIVKMKVGHPGFPLIEIAANKPSFERLTDEDATKQISRMLDIAEVDFSDRLSVHWLLTSIDNGRKVEFWLYRPNEHEPYRTAEGAKARPGALITTEDDGDGGVRNTCGGSTSACPIFFDPDDPTERLELEELIGNAPAGPSWR